MHFTRFGLYWLAITGITSGSVTLGKKVSSSPVTSIKPTTNHVSAANAPTPHVTSIRTAPLAAMLESEFLHPTVFCNFYLSNGLNQSLSASNYLSAPGLTKACQSLVPKLQKQSTLPRETKAPTCDPTALSVLTVEFTYPAIFCRYWTAAGPQEFLPLNAFTTLAQVSKGCQCLSSSVPITSSSRKVTIARTTPISTTAVIRSTTTVSRTTSITRTTIKTFLMTSKSTTAVQRSTTMVQYTTSTTTTVHATTTTASTTATTTMAPIALSTLPAFYLRIKGLSSSQYDPDAGQTIFQGYWINPTTYDQNNGEEGLYLAVTEQRPLTPFYLSSNNNLMMLPNTTFDSRPHYALAEGDPDVSYGLYMTTVDIGASLVSWAWNQTDNSMRYTSSNFTSFCTCSTDTAWEAWTRPYQPLFVSGPQGCVNWDLEAIPASNFDPKSPDVILPRPAAPTAIPLGLSQAYWAPPFRIRLNGTQLPSSSSSHASTPVSSNGVTGSNYAGYALSFVNYTTAAGDSLSYLGLAPSQIGVSSMNLIFGNSLGTSGAILAQINSSTAGAIGFASSQGSVTERQFIYMRPYLTDLVWNYDYLHNTLTPMYDLTEMVVMTCPAKDETGNVYWNPEVMPVPPIITASAPVAGCQVWNITAAIS
ncbi:hypothetical protein K461DRAFT_303061 [Myriangium duriaei CBS 260.36]|uniref:Uncharacterized protein n=1 Tax=Myriangium duriaei CBS 260.36 TaxID=1168546 RepID=A0A9P4MJR1_9PEZI|nr:hypothetical protein K461DRAFT_303061 [Myriangium duriaei CBS 260.36]